MKLALFPSLSFGLLTLGLLVGHARAQGPSKPEGAQTTPKPAARPADVASVESIIAAVYDVISGPAGQKRDWERMRSLFAPGARLIPTSPVRAPGAKPDAPLTGTEAYASNVLDVEGYITRSSKFLEEQGFFERETARRVETYGHIAHVWSTYEARRKAEDAEPFMLGINSIQLMNDGKRWWVVTIFWEAETPRTPLPKEYLKSAP
ncbi:MAG TPA: hypothetical protein VF508_14030 [Pyrinomonadaceae bacterium]|jgi:hypothetical protein